jgi:hypothetical protein
MSQVKCDVCGQSRAEGAGHICPANDNVRIPYDDVLWRRGYQRNKMAERRARERQRRTEEERCPSPR